MDVDVIVTRLNALIALTMFVIIAVVKKMIFKHENFELDLTSAHRAKLFKDNKLLFLGDGYKAITMLIRNAKDSVPVKEKFNAQLKTRQKPKFTVKKDDLEALRLQALKELKPTQTKPKRNKSKKQWDMLTS